MAGNRRHDRTGSAKRYPDRDADRGGLPAQFRVPEAKADQDTLRQTQAARQRYEDRTATQQPWCTEYRKAPVTAERTSGVGDDIRWQRFAQRVHGGIIVLRPALGVDCDRGRRICDEALS